MKSSRPLKKKPEELQRDELREIEMSSEDWQEFEHGVRLFNSGKFWHSHEAWEEIWKRHREDERLFFQGIIQMAAACHQLVTKKSYKGMLSNLDKAYEKLDVFQPEYLGVRVEPLLRWIRQAKDEAEHLGPADLERFNFHLIPKLEFHKPTNPDLMVEIRDIVRADQFNEGLRLFNTGYYWEAHEAWEEVWRSQEGEGKDFAQAFVQVAAGYSFLKLCKLSSARYLFEKSFEKFRQFEYLESGVDIASLVEALQPALEVLAEMPSNGNLNGRLPKPVIKLKPHNGHAVSGVR